MANKTAIKVVVADESHEKYVDTILKTIEDAAKVRGTGIAKRTHEYLTAKMREAKAVIALDGETFAGFSYILACGHRVRAKENVMSLMRLASPKPR